MEENQLNDICQSKKRSREALSLDQRKIIYQNWKEGKIVEEIVVELQKIYGEFAPSRRTVYYWVKRFDDGDEQIEDHKRSGKISSRVVKYITPVTCVQIHPYHRWRRQKGRLGGGTFSKKADFSKNTRRPLCVGV
jgi:hypothetical protein